MTENPLAAALAQPGAGDQAAAEATHYLHLADGSTVLSSGAIPTHVATGDQVIPVMAAYER